MGRPRKEGMDYFPHDVDAAQDEKIEAMRTMFGNDGYAFYFITLERIYRSDSGELDVSNKLFLVTLANKVMVNLEKIEEMIQASIDFGLFDKDVFISRKVLTSNGIKKRSVQINAIRNKWRKGKDEQISELIDGKLGFSTEKTDVFHEEKCIKESKGKESKVKQRKENKKESKTAHAEFVHLHDSEYQTLVEKHGEQMTQELIDILDNYKGMTGKKYESDYRAILNWVVDRYNENKQKQQRPAPSLHSATFQKPSPTAKPKIEPAQHAPPDDEPFDLDAALDLAKFFDSRKPKGESDEIPTARQQLAPQLD
jgi:hypothetical protein